MEWYSIGEYWSILLNMHVFHALFSSFNSRHSRMVKIANYKGIMDVLTLGQHLRCLNLHLINNPMETIKESSVKPTKYLFKTWKEYIRSHAQAQPSTVELCSWSTAWASFRDKNQSKKCCSTGPSIAYMCFIMKSSPKHNLSCTSKWFLIWMF